MLWQCRLYVKRNNCKVIYLALRFIKKEKKSKNNSKLGKSKVQSIYLAFRFIKRKNQTLLHSKRKKKYININQTVLHPKQSHKSKY